MDATTRWRRAQTAVLAAGTLFAWTTVVLDFRRFARAGGPNPLLTPCFYGAILFLVALVWAATLPAAPAARRRGQGQLVAMLVAGTLFAWGNFTYELIRYCLRDPGAVYRSCAGTVAAHPVFTPCFVGAVLYLTALALALVTRHRALRAPGAPTLPA